MKDPAVMSYERPMYGTESTDYGKFNITDLYFDFGLSLSEHGSNEPILVPPQIGRFVIAEKDILPDGSFKEVWHEPVNCTENAFQKVTEEINETK